MSVLSPQKKRWMGIAAAAAAISISLSGVFTSAAFATEGDPAPADTTPVVEVLTDPVQAAEADTSSVEAPAAEEVSEAPVAEAPVAAEPEATTPEADAPSSDAVDESTLVSPPADVSSDRKTDTPKKVFVCKFVGTPGVNERLQTGQNPISVSVNSIKGWDGVIPGYFADAQGRSYTLAYDEGQAEPDVSACPTPVVVCENSGALNWTRDAHLTTVTVTLKKGFDSCDVSLNSYETEGPNWETSGTQVFIDHATAHLTKENPTATLTVKVQGCFQQQDLYIGTTRYDGVDGALPHYPNSATPAGLIDHWNGATDCTPPPPVVKDANPSYEGQSSCVPDGDASGGVATLHFTNVVELADGETAKDAVFTYTDVEGEIQTVTVKANEVVDVTLTFPLGSGQYVVTVTTEGVEGAATLTVNTDCAPMVYVTPVSPVYGSSTECGVLPAFSIPGATLDEPATVNFDPETGVLTSFSSYSSDQGGYNVVYTVSADGIPQVDTLFIQIGEATIKEPEPGDDYVITVIGEVRYATWTHTYDKVTVCPTIIAAPPAPVVVAPTCDVDGSLPTLVAGENYTASYNRPFDGPGAYTAVYTATGLNEFSTGKTVSYDLTVKGKTGDCPTTIVTGNTPPTLAYTGAAIAGPIGLVIALLSAGFILLFVKNRERVLGLARRIARRPIAE